MQSDPIGLEGGINAYTYTENNPVNTVDYLGLYTEIFIGNSIVWGRGSQFGHSAIDMNGIVYSRSHSTYFTTTRDDYLNRQQFRDTIGLLLNTTPEEELILKKDLDERVKKNKPYDLFDNSCSTNVADVLENINIHVRGPWQFGNAIAPVDLLINLPKTGRVIQRKFYEKK